MTAEGRLVSLPFVLCAVARAPLLSPVWNLQLPYGVNEACDKKKVLCFLFSENTPVSLTVGF